MTAPARTWAATGGFFAALLAYNLNKGSWAALNPRREAEVPRAEGRRR